MKPKSASHLRTHLLEIASLARQEQASPTGLHMTCLSLIEKTAKAALKELEALPSAERARMDLEQRVAQRRENGRGW